MGLGLLVLGSGCEAAQGGPEAAPHSPRPPPAGWWTAAASDAG